jgi:ADP-ribose pyrophosphatase
VGVLPFLDPDTVVLVRQYRYVAGRHTWEMPTGGARPGEPIQDAAQRELAEESGYRAGRLEPVCSYHTSKSVMDETAHLFLGFDSGSTVRRLAGAPSDASLQVEGWEVPGAIAGP